MQYILTILAVVFGGLFYKIKKNRVNTAVLEQEKMKTVFNEIDKNINKNKELLSTEEQKRQKIAEEFDADAKKVVNINDIVDFFNKLK